MTDMPIRELIDDTGKLTERGELAAFEGMAGNKGYPTHTRLEMAMQVIEGLLRYLDAAETEVGQLRAELAEARTAVAQHVARLIYEEFGPEADRAHEWLIAKLSEGPTDPQSENVCRRCHGPNITWSAPSPLWNQVMRGGDINGPWQWEEIICPICFAILAEQAGIAGLWRLHAERVHVPLQTVTPSGRTWNEQTWLWDDAPGRRAEQDATITRLELELDILHRQRQALLNLCKSAEQTGLLIHHGQIHDLLVIIPTDAELGTVARQSGTPDYVEGPGGIRIPRDVYDKMPKHTQECALVTTHHLTCTCGAYDRERERRAQDL